MVQINGKLCARLDAPADAGAVAVERAALDAPGYRPPWPVGPSAASSPARLPSSTWLCD